MQIAIASYNSHFSSLFSCLKLAFLKLLPPPTPFPLNLKLARNFTGVGPVSLAGNRLGKSIRMVCKMYHSGLMESPGKTECSGDLDTYISTYILSKLQIKLWGTHTHTHPSHQPAFLFLHFFCRHKLRPSTNTSFRLIFQVSLFHGWKMPIYIYIPQNIELCLKNENKVCLGS